MEKYKYGEKLTLFEPLDLSPDGHPWGSQARVFLGEVKQTEQVELVAVKLMRTEERCLESFMRELRILSRLDQGLTVITPVIDCGIIHPSKKIIIDDTLQGFDGVSGNVDHFGINGLMDLHEKLKGDFRGIPFISIQLRDGMEINLDEIVEKDFGYLPVPDVLSIGMQLMEVLKEAHRNDVIYADSRPIHFYISFQDIGQVRLKIIDWNASMILAEEGLDPAVAKQKDLKEIVANLLFPLFTGRRLANSSKSVGRDHKETRMHLDTHYSIDNWKKDDEERLDKDIRELLYDAVVNETIKTPEQFVERLSIICNNWFSNVDGEFLQAIRKLHLAYHYLNESHSYLGKITEELFHSNGFPYVRNEAQRLFFIANDMKTIWRLYSIQIKRKNRNKS